MSVLSVELQTRLRNRSHSISHLQLLKNDELEMTLPGAVPVWENKKSSIENECAARVGRWKSTANLTTRELAKPNIFTDPGRIGRNHSASKPPVSRPRSRRQSLASALRAPVNLKNDIKKLWERRPSFSDVVSKRLMNNGNKSDDEEEKEDLPDTNEIAKEYGVPQFFIVDAKAWDQRNRIKTATKPSAN